MSVDPKVIAAVSTAVGLYLQAEQEALLSQQPVSRPAQPAVVISSAFAIAGRQGAMNVRWMWQMRLPR